MEVRRGLYPQPCFRGYRPAKKKLPWPVSLACAFDCVMFGIIVGLLIGMIVR